MKNLILIIIAQFIVFQASATQPGSFLSLNERDPQGTNVADDENKEETNESYEDKVASQYYENLRLEKEHEEFIRKTNRYDQY